MLRQTLARTVGAAALAAAAAFAGASAQADTPHIKKVFVIALENHNWRQPASVSSPEQIFLNPAAPFLNSLVNGKSGISSQVAWAKAYQNSYAGVHPSEPNYIWAEAGSNFGVANDDTPYHSDCTPDTVQTTSLHLSAFLSRSGKMWRSYQEDIDVDASNNPLPTTQWTVPLFNVSGTWAAPGVNEYNYSNQYNYAAKHNPMVFFTDTNGGCDTTTANRMRYHYYPLQRLALDLTNGTTADYNWITPDQYNDQHTTLNNGYGQFPNSGATADSARIAQGDNFLARVVPLIMSSDAYQDNGAIVLWWDETEEGDTANFTLPFIVISKLVKPNLNGVPYSNTVSYTHSSTLRTMQEIFGVDPAHNYPWLGAAAYANDLSDLFASGVIVP